jgi:hypothetical protein
VLDTAGWADVVAWLSNEKNVAQLLTDWQAQREQGEHSIATRLDAADAQLRELRGKMGALAETIAETSRGESRRTLQEKLDRYADQVTAEEKKREQLFREAADAKAYAAAGREVREWSRIVAARGRTAAREEQRDVLRALGAQVTIWRDDYRHPDGWPQRYRIILRFTGFTGHPVTLPPAPIVSPTT